MQKKRSNGTTLTHSHFVHLGSVGPDYSYLDFFEAAQKVAVESPLLIFPMIVKGMEAPVRNEKNEGIIASETKQSHFMKTLFHFTFVLIVFLIIPAQGNAQPLFEVERESFCKVIREREPIDSFTGIAEIRKGEGVFLWMEMKAGERALTMLEAKGQMPIYHAWASEKWVTDVIDIGIKEKDWTEQANAIRNQVRRQGFFTWRTHSFKRNFKEGRWYVSVLDANKRPVRKSGSGTEPFRPEIVIKFVSNVP